MITKQQLYQGLKGTSGLPVAYHHFDNPPTIPFIVYMEVQKDRYVADNSVYFKKAKYRIELYYEVINDELIEKIESYLDSKELVWADGEEVYIEEEKLYMRSYYI